MLPCFERHGFVVNCVQEEVMDDFLHSVATFCHVPVAFELPILEDQCLFGRGMKALLDELLYLGIEPPRSQQRRPQVNSAPNIVKR